MVAISGTRVSPCQPRTLRTLRTVRRVVLSLLVVVAAVLAVLSPSPSSAQVPVPHAAEAADRVTALTSPTPTPTPRASAAVLAARRAPVGVSPGFGIIDQPVARQAADFAAARRAGITRVRLDIGWARVEQSPGAFSWADTDRMIRSARTAGLTVLGVVGYRPDWAPSLETAAGRAAFARFVGQAARRYAGPVSAWELWNEPNRTLAWRDRPDPVAYARMVNVVSPALRRGDPGARVLVGAMAPAVDAADGSEISPIAFLQRMYAAGVSRRAFTAVSVHPYSYPVLPSQAEQWNTFHRLGDLHAVMRRAGDGAKKIWITEYGAPTGSAVRAVATTLQSRMVTDAVGLARKNTFLGPIYLYALRDLTDQPLDLEANFGLIRHDGTPKPAYWALKRMLRPAA